MRDRVGDPKAFVEDAVRGAQEGDRTSERSGGEEYKPWNVINPVHLEGKAIPQRVWIVQDWVPLRATTSLYADGGIGKTILALMLQVACAISGPWCGLAVKPCRSFGLYCEDDEDELHYRVSRMCDHYGTGFSQLEHMRYISGFGCNNILVEPEDYAMRRTSRLIQLEAGIIEHRAELAVLDVAAELFAGNEVDRNQVRGFIAHLNALAGRTGCAILLTAHPSMSGLSDKGDMSGGSTAWNNSVRSRLALVRPKAVGDEIEDRDARVLSSRKANYSATGGTIKLRWQGGVIAPEPGVNTFSAAFLQASAEIVFMELLGKTDREGRHVSAARTSGNYAPAMFGSRPDRGGHTRKDFDGAMQRLFVANKIRVVEYGRAGASGRPKRIEAVTDG